MIDDDADGSILAENNWLSGNRGLKKSISINGDTTETLASADFVKTTASVITFTTLISTTLEFKKGFCSYIVDNVIITDDLSVQFGKSNMVANSLNALGTGSTDTNFKIIAGIYNLYCLIDLNLNGTYDTGDYETLIENYDAANNSSLSVTNFTQR